MVEEQKREWRTKMDYQDLKKRIKKFLNHNNRSVIVMMNAAIVLVVVILSMVVQLVHLNNQEKQQGLMESRASDVGQTLSEPVSVKPQISEISKEEAEDRIRNDLDNNKPMVALTFDDGPYTEVTNQLVKSLAKNDGRATFFVVGNRVEKYKDYAKAMKNAYKHGNQIATHTYAHSDLSKMSKAQIKKEMSLAVQTIRQVIGQEPTMLRPPYGNTNERMRKNVHLPMIYWSVDTQDWSSRNTEKVLERCRYIQDGDIVLMHDLYPTTAEAVKKLIPRLKKKGFQLVTVEELFYYKGIQAEEGKSYYNGR